jgi:pimeloyl-ACP methyl ester carboxylesterase
VIFSYFGPPERKLLGTLARTKRLKARGAAVLLCNPLGEEAVRAHRSYRVLATQLAQLGYDVLRFDYGNTGDSMGESEGASVDGWLTDIERASAQLRSATNGRPLVVVGLRFGATLAALAAARRNLKLRHLALWDPVIDGTAYLRALGDAHDEYMRGEVGDATWSRRAPRRTETPSEALGMPISATLASELRGIDLTKETLQAEQITVVSTSTDEPRLDALRDRLSAQRNATWLPVTSRTPWNSDAVLNSQVVPMDILERLIARIEESCP